MTLPKTGQPCDRWYHWVQDDPGAFDHLQFPKKHPTPMSSSDPERDVYEALALPAQQQFVRMFVDLATGIPLSSEPLSAKPKERAREIVRVAGLKAGAMSAGLARPPGPMGMLTVIPDL